MTRKRPVTWKPDGTLSHLGDPDWLRDDHLQHLMFAFESAGYHIYGVGGCVRDTVLNRIVADVDLATDSAPEETIRIIQSLTTDETPWKAVPTGIDHGTITAVSRERTFEITTFRRDVETDGRHATVAFSANMNDDAVRRDFTINALYTDRHGNVFDVVRGSNDLSSGTVRFIGDPMARIQEDYLRILRFFRFSATHGNPDIGINAEGLAACAELAHGLEGVSRERIGAEFNKIIADANAAPTIGSMEKSGVLNRILPGASVATLARLIDLEGQVPPKLQPVLNVPTRLAALGCENIADRLRLSKVQASKVDLTRSQAGLMTPMHELGYRFGAMSALHCALLRWATLLVPIDEVAIDQIQLGADAKFPVAAPDLIPLYQGKALGDRLSKLETEWLMSQFTLTKSDLLALP